MVQKIPRSIKNAPHFSAQSGFYRFRVFSGHYKKLEALPFCNLAPQAKAVCNHCNKLAVGRFAFNV